MGLFSVKSADFINWAGIPSNRRAQEDFPRLLRLLIFATNPTVLRNEFPTGDNINTPGWDGVTEASRQTQHVPVGTVVWELGVGEDYKAKAQSDYNNRSQSKSGPNSEPLNQCTFIFVTPRLWDRKGLTKQKWVADRKKQGIWADVRLYDAETLEAWIEQATGVERWFLERTGRPDGIYSLDGWWRNWCHSTFPIQDEQSVRNALGNEKALRQRIKEWLNAVDGPTLNPAARPGSGSARLLTLHCENLTREATLAHFVAVLLQFSTDEFDKLLARTVVVENLKAWRELMLSHSPLIMISLFGQHGQVQLAVVDHKHHVVLSLEMASEWPDMANIFVIETTTSPAK